MPTPPKVCIINLARGSEHPFDPNVVEYDRCRVIDGEPDFTDNHAASGVRLNLTINDSTTWAEIKAAVTADATTAGFLP